MADLRKRQNLLPDHARPRERAIADTDGRLEDLDADRVRRVRDDDRAADEDLRFLAYERSVDVWDARWTEAVRRAVVKAAPTVHRHKGTPGSVQLALGALGIDARVTEWWQASPRRAPYTFQVTAFVRGRLYDGAVLDTRLIRVVHATVMRTKPLSRAFELTVAATMPATLGIAAAAVGRAHVAAALRPAASATFSSALGLAPVAVARVRVSALMHASA